VRSVSNKEGLSLFANILSLHPVYKIISLNSNRSQAAVANCLLPVSCFLYVAHDFMLYFSSFMTDVLNYEQSNVFRVERQQVAYNL